MERRIKETREERVRIKQAEKKKEEELRTQEKVKEIKKMHEATVEIARDTEDALWSYWLILKPQDQYRYERVNSSKSD